MVKIPPVQLDNQLLQTVANQLLRPKCRGNRQFHQHFLIRVVHAPFKGISRLRDNLGQQAGFPLLDSQHLVPERFHAGGVADVYKRQAWRRCSWALRWG